MTTATLPNRVPRVPVAALPVLLRLALRDLRGGLKGFYVFLACVALGVAVITGVSALNDALRAGFERQGRTLLGGDVAVARIHLRASEAERAWLARQVGDGGRVSEIGTLRSMARRTDGQSQILVELKGVDPAYPLTGAIEVADNKTLDATIRAGHVALVEQLLLDRLGLHVGGELQIGSARLTIGGVLLREPDALADRLPFGPRVLVSMETLEATGLVQPGSLIRWVYRLTWPDQGRAATQGDFSKTLTAAFPEGGFHVTDRNNPSPTVTRSIDRVRQFLTLIGLTALLVGGVGVANAVTTFVERKRRAIGTLKSVGATRAQVFAILFIEVGILALLGVAIGLLLGSTLPAIAAGLLGNALPIALETTLRPLSLVIAALYGLLVALAFMLWPLGLSGQVRATVLFRDEVEQSGATPPRRILLATLLTVLALAALAILSSDARLMALWFCLGLVGILAVFAGLGWAIMAGARRLPRPRRPEMTLALGNIAGPGSLTRSIVLSLGLGLSLLVAVALVNAAIIAEFVERLPANAPTYYVLDITKAEWPRFVETVRTAEPKAEVADAPMLRGRLVALAGKPVEQIKAPPEAQWVLTGDRGLSFSEAVPQGSKVVAGSWWTEGDAGQPLVSFEAELARKLGVGIGDTVTVNVLGRNVTARITNLREIKWENLTINFVLVFSPSTLKAAPYNMLAAVTLPHGTSTASEAELLRTLSTRFPTFTTLRVRDAIEQFNLIFGKVMAAVQVAGGVTLLSGAIVLAGALATAQRRRIYQAVLLKTLGATRRRILAIHVIEYLALAVMTALISVVVGAIAAYIVERGIMELDFVFSFSAVAGAVGIAVLLVLSFGLFGTWRVLSARTVPYLRSE